MSYYRKEPYSPVFIGIWREVGDRLYVLQRKIVLPPANIGMHIIRLDELVPVDKGDIVGIHYNQKTAQSPLGIATNEDTGIVPENELFETLVTPVYDENIRVGEAINLDEYGFAKKRKAYAMDLIMATNNITLKTTGMEGIETVNIVHCILNIV